MSGIRRAITGGMVLTLLGLWLCPSEAWAAKKVLRLRLDGPVTESPSDAAGFMALFEQKETRTLHEWVDTIRQAGNDRDIAGLILILEQPEIKLAQVEELTRAIQAFRAKNKPVYCYMDEAGNASYALAAAANHITLAENSELEIVGLRAEVMYFKGLLDKLGIEAEMMHCGAYKSALEPFTRTEPSPEAAANINWLLDGLFDRWIGLIAQGRNLSADEVRKLVDNAPLSAEQALKAKLVDEVSSFPAFKKRIQKEFGKDVEVLKRYTESTESEVDMQNPFAIFDVVKQLMKGAATAETSEPGIGLIYVDGGIVVGKSDQGSFGGNSAGSTTIRAALEQAREDENIRAIVVRVDSPGGSALASDIVWEAARRCGKEKPLFVSMGGVAGSGGYYVSLPADTIFAEASTITGSIGVVGGKVVLGGLLEGKLGITTTQFARGAHAGLMSGTRKWTDDERAWMTNYMNGVYEQFKGRVTASRGERLKKNLEDIAGGRVYTGQQALELGLVDQLGGLADALDFAAKKTGLGKDYRVTILPKPSGFAEFVAMLQQMMGEDKKDEFQIMASSNPLGGDPLLRSALPLLRQLAPAQFSEALRALRDLALLQHERVGCFMPAVPQVR